MPGYPAAWEPPLLTFRIALVSIRETAGRAPMPGYPAAWEPPLLTFRIGS